MASRKLPPPGRHKLSCPFCRLPVFVEVKGEEITAHHKAPVCAKFDAEARSTRVEVATTPGKDVRQKFDD